MMITDTDWNELKDEVGKLRKDVNDLIQALARYGVVGADTGRNRDGLLARVTDLEDLAESGKTAVSLLSPVDAMK